MKPEPKLMKDGTAVFLSLWRRLAGKEDASKDLCKEFWIIPADWSWIENEDWIAISNLPSLGFSHQPVQVSTTIPFGIIAMSTDRVQLLWVQQSPVCNRLQRDNTLGTKLMHENG
jgi:hypothetical protein